MKILRVDLHNPNPKAIAEAVQCLRRGGILVYPTDTCYGLGADMTNPISVDKIYKIKERQDKKPLSVIIKNVNQLKKYALVDNNQEAILRKYLPGPFTFVLLSSDYKTFKQSSIGIRIPEYKITRLISDKFYTPYATTSANKSGYDPCYNLDCILAQFENAQYKPNLILDVGELLKNPPSTVVDLSQWPPHIIRQGSGKFDFEEK